MDTKRPTVLRKQKERKQEKHKLTELAMFLLGLENYSEDERKRQGTKHSIHPTRAANRYSSVVPCLFLMFIDGSLWLTIPTSPKKEDI